MAPSAVAADIVKFGAVEATSHGDFCITGGR
jgi:hypothetical protein